MNEEIIMKAMQFQKKAEETEKNLEFVEEQINELEEFKKNLENLENSKEKEILASLGKGVFIKSEIKDKELFVNVGAGVVIKKSLNGTKKVIEEQIKKFLNARIQLNSELETYRQELVRLINELENLKKTG